MNSVFVKLFRLTALETEVLFLSTEQVQRQQQCKLHPTASPLCCKPWPRERPLAGVKRLVQSPCSLNRYCGCHREYPIVIVDRYPHHKSTRNWTESTSLFHKNYRPSVKWFNFSYHRPGPLVEVNGSMSHCQFPKFSLFINTSTASLYYILCRNKMCV